MCLRALAGLEPARVPPGLDGRAVRRLIGGGVSVSVASLLVMAFRLGVLVYAPWSASGTKRTVLSPLVAVMLPLRPNLGSYPHAFVLSVKVRLSVSYLLG